MALNIGDIVKIFHFDDGNQELLENNCPNLWRIIEFRFNKSKSTDHSLNCIMLLLNDYVCCGY